MIGAFSVGPPWWDDATVFLIGGGPSLRGFDFRRLEGRGHLLGVNQAMLDAPVEAGISIDHQFISGRRAELARFARERTLYLSVGPAMHPDMSPSVFVDGAVMLDSEVRKGLSENPRVVRRGATSGYTALNVATLKRARRIVLLGYDYTTMNGHHHYHDSYPWHHRAADQSWSVWVRCYGDAARDCERMGVEVINASPDSHLTVFPRCTIEEALSDSVLRPPVLAAHV